MKTAIKRIYENGLLTLFEPAPYVGKSEVEVTFLDQEKAKKPLKKGIKLGNLEGKFALPDDFNDPLDNLADYM